MKSIYGYENEDGVWIDPDENAITQKMIEDADRNTEYPAYIKLYVTTDDLVDDLKEFYVPEQSTQEEIKNMLTEKFGSSWMFWHTNNPNPNHEY